MVWLHWQYMGGYDAVTSIDVDAAGRVSIQRGTYHSHPSTQHQADPRRLRSLVDAVSNLPAGQLAAPPPAASAFISELHLAQGRVLRWHGGIPAQPRALHDLLAYLDGLG